MTEDVRSGFITGQDDLSRGDVVITGEGRPPLYKVAAGSQVLQTTQGLKLRGRRRTPPIQEQEGRVIVLRSCTDEVRPTGDRRFEGCGGGIRERQGFDKPGQGEIFSRLVARLGNAVGEEEPRLPGFK